MEFQGKSYTIQPPKPGFLTLYIQVKPEKLFIFTLSIKPVKNFYYEHLGEVFTAAKHQRGKTHLSD